MELGVSSVLALTVFSGFAAVEDDESFFLVTAASTVFFFTLSLFALTTSVFTLAFSFWLFSFCGLSAWLFDADLVEDLLGAAELLEADALLVVAQAWGFEETGGVLIGEGISSMGSSLTGVASPLSTAWWDGSSSSPDFFFLIFFVFKALELDFEAVEEEEVGW